MKSGTLFHIRSVQCITVDSPRPTASGEQNTEHVALLIQMTRQHHKNIDSDNKSPGQYLAQHYSEAVSLLTSNLSDPFCNLNLEHLLRAGRVDWRCGTVVCHCWLLAVRPLIWFSEGQTQANGAPTTTTTVVLDSLTLVVTHFNLL